MVDYEDGPHNPSETWPLPTPLTLDSGLSLDERWRHRQQMETERHRQT